MSNFKKYMSVIQEMKISKGLKDKIKNNEFIEKNENKVKLELATIDILNQKIKVRIKMSEKILENIKDVFIENNLLTLDTKEKITPKEFDVLVKFKQKWVSIYDTHAEIMSIIYKNKDVNDAIKEINLFLLMNNTNILPDMITSDTFIDTALDFFTEYYVVKNEIKKEISPDLFQELRKNDKLFVNNFSEFIKELNMQLAILVKKKLKLS